MQKLGKGSKSLEELTRTTTTDDVVNEYLQSKRTRHPPLRTLGFAQDRRVQISEEDRESHIHILGAPGEGKSKFLELLIRGDIDKGYPCCLIDPSMNGDTAVSILKYCASIGFEKVCYISPADFFKFNRIPVINPFVYKAPPEVTVGNLMDAMSVLWGTEWQRTPRIQRYVSHVLHTLICSGNTLAESQYFMSRLYTRQRDEMFTDAEKHPLYQIKNRRNLDPVYKTPFTFENFQSSINRLDVFNDRIIRCIVGSKLKGLPWKRFVKERWVILVNLFTQSVWGEESLQRQALGTLVINEIFRSIMRLMEHGWEGRYYLYIDECGQFVTQKIANVFDYYRHLGLRLTLAHQRYDQIHDSNILSSVRTGPKIKVLFHTPNEDDRRMMMKDMGFGGELPDRQVLYTLRETEKQHAYISINKMPPRKIRILDMQEPQVSKEALRAYKEKLFAPEWFHTKEEINNEINARFAQPQSTAPVLSRRPKRPPTVEPSREQQRQGKGKGRATRRAVPDNQPDSAPVLLSKKGRATRKVSSDPAAEDKA